MILCPNLLAPDTGSVVFNNQVGEKAEYSCDKGQILVGEEQRICQANGEWSGNEPICVLLCPDLDDPQNGTVSQNGSVPSSVATYTCNEGFRPNTTALIRECMFNGEWLGQEVTCER